MTFDLDVEEELQHVFRDLVSRKAWTNCAIGVNESGKRTIEGLLPDRVRSAVFGANHEVQQSMFGTKGEQTSAKNKLKRLMLDEFKKTARPGDEDYGKFYSLVKLLNKAFSDKSET